MRILLFWLLLVAPVLALTEPQSQLMSKMQQYFTYVGMDENAKWLKGEVQAGRIKFGTFTGKEAVTAAYVNVRTGVMTINENTLASSDFRTLVDLGSTLAHERKHQKQSYLGWALATYQEDLGQGNPYEREGWAESIRVARAATISLQKRLKQAKSAREREVAGRQLKAAVDSWTNLAVDWKTQSKIYGNFGANDFRDEDGVPITLDDMARERAVVSSLARDAIVTSKAMNTVSYSGKYRGGLGGGAKGTFAFDVRPDQSLVGKISGTHKSGPFQGVLEGRVNVDGLVSGQIVGTVKVGKTSYKFTGSFSGSSTGSSASGRWSAGTEKVWPSGTWSVNKL